ncbi:helix-turn-helix domain-containing protein [Streptomyces sp. NPDC085481]|uniref:helix-turn-helix domain-containing protein n=1 Tax=Streptomyces sp. NPDC085481 TaxID=3365727 RepID=UPI0037D2A970
MDSQNTSARPSTPSRNGGKNHSHRGTSGGVIHENTRHTERFTIVGNHLLQHGELTGLAIGIGSHIQSLPEGAPIDIKSIARNLREGTTRTARAMRELEAHGYLRRERVRLPNGRIVTRTVFCNQPDRGRTSADTRTARPAAPKPKSQPKPRPEPRRRALPAAPEPAPTPRPEPRRRALPAAPEPAPTPRPEPRRRALPPVPKPAPTPRPEPRRRALPAVPQPGYPAPDLLLTAAEVLTGLRLRDPRLLLSAADTEHLAPGVAAWLERDVAPDAVRHALTADLPEPLWRPAALLAHRLAALLPAPPPFRAPAPQRHPLQNCDVCDRAYRGPEPGRCGSCRLP